MEDVHHSVKGEESIRNLVNDYNELLTILGEKGAVREAKVSPQSPTKFEARTQSVLQRMKTNLVELRLSYNVCAQELSVVPDELFKVPKVEENNTEITTGNESVLQDLSTQRERLSQALQQRNEQLKVLIDDIRNMVWYADVHSCETD